MKSDAKRYLYVGVTAFFALFLSGIALMWLLDDVFSGSVVNFLNSLVAGVNDDGGVRFQGGSLAAVGAVLTALLSAALAGTGALCAYNAHKKQRALFLQAREDAEKAQSLAEREMQRKSDLITYLAHDLRTPLSSVLAYLSLLSESPELSPEQRAKYTGVALDKAYRLERLIDELFEIIRFNLQTITVNRENIRLKLMLMQLADEFYPILLPKDKTIAVACDDALTLRGDADKLARVFNNILKNAAAYSYDHTEISVSARQTGDQIELEFVNAGDPIPEESRKRIFEKFYRLDAARSAQTGGAGLGLAIAKEIVDAHGGEISVSSDEGGTRFTVRLPA